MPPTKIPAHSAHSAGHLTPTDQNAGAPVFKLHRDLLWKIFMMNADLDADTVLAAGSDEPRVSFYYRFNSLTIARRTSQVCTQWRDLMINSPSLWGRCIDVERLNQRQPCWRDEVFRRTGQALLHVKGTIETPDLANIFLCILDTEWARIGTLDVGVYDASAVDDLRWSALQRPAPALQSFFMSFDGDTPNILSTPGNILFANHAPALVDFASDDSGILFRSPSSWFFQIRHFDIRGPFTVPQLLDALSQMLCLEYLHVHQNSNLDTPSSSFPHIHFSKLQHIHLSSTLPTCLKLLEHITPAPACNLMVFAEDENSLEIGNTQLSTILSRYAKGCFNSNNPLLLTLEMKPYNFLFHCKNSNSSQEFFISIDCSVHLPPQINDTLISLLASGPFINVYSLAIFSSLHNPTTIAAISSLLSVETLDTTEIVLDAVVTLSNDESEHPLLPFLKTLKCRAYHLLTLGFLKSFLFHRQKLGVPIIVLDITTSLRPSFRELQTFDEFNGLQVLWTQKGALKEYICGLGYSEYSDQAVDSGN